MKASAIKYQIIHNRKNELNSQGEAVLQVRATKDRKQVYFSTGIYLKPEQWNEKKQEVTAHKDKHALNRQIEGFVQHLKDLENTGREKNAAYSVADLKADYSQSNTGSYTHFCAFAFAQLDKEQQTIKKRTYLNRKQTLDSFREFAKGRDEFGKITYPLIDEFFKQYLHSKGRTLAPGTLDKHLRHLKLYERQAVDMGYLKPEQTPFSAYNRGGKNFKLPKSERDWLEPYELERLEAYPIPEEKPHWAIIRDFYLFMCYTGLRFADAAAVSRKNIKKTPEGYELTTTAEKTKKRFTLELYLVFPSQDEKDTRPEKLIKKYWKDSDRAFFATTRSGTGKPSNQYVNREIKAIAAAAGITGKNLTCHTARHTFASFLITRVPITVVRDLLQHGKIETTMIYAHQSKGTIKQHLKNVDW